MVKNIIINASYLNQSHIFECSRQEFLNKAAEHFNIDIRDVELFSLKKGNRHKIKPVDITDLMKIEIVQKGNATMGSLRASRSCTEDGKAKLRDTVITKLTHNTTLTGEERKATIEWLQVNSSVQSSKKRKIDVISPRRDVSHKKVQVNITCTHSKDSFSQTDFINTAPEVAHTQEEVSSKIKKLAVNSDVNKEEVAFLMKESFDDRRNFILIKAPPVCSVKHKYPQLFSVDEVKNELDRIFYAKKCDDFITNMHKYAHLIIQKCNHSSDLYIRTEKSIERAHTEIQKKYARAVGSVFLLTQLMEEDWHFMHLQDYPHGSHDIYPHIDASCHCLKDLFFDNILYHIVVEGQHLCEASNFLEAVLCLIASFFIFNIDYPESNRRTMIMFEKLYLDANDTTDIDDLTMQMVKLLKLEAKSGQ